jgi:hypothetical protein
MIDLLAHDQPARVTAAWAVAIVLAAATFLALVQAAPLDRTVAAFVAAEAAATAGLLLLLPRERAVRPA